MRAAILVGIRQSSYMLCVDGLGWILEENLTEHLPSIVSCPRRGSGRIQVYTWSYLVGVSIVERVWIERMPERDRDSGAPHTEVDRGWQNQSIKSPIHSFECPLSLSDFRMSRSPCAQLGSNITPLNEPPK